MIANSQLVLPYSVDGVLYAIPVEFVDQVFSAVEITPATDSPPAHLGLINLHGEIIPVISMRRRLNLSDRAMQLSDCMIVIRQAAGLHALLVDSVSEVMSVSEQAVTATPRTADGTTYVSGVTAVTGGIMQIHDVDAFLLPASRLSAYGGVDKGPVRVEQ